MKLEDLKKMSVPQLEALAQKIRERILDVVSRRGGHLSSTLGATDLIVAMHYVFDASKDPFIFDVSHQSYAHKLLTGRWEAFETLRQFGGISGYTKPDESPYDYYVAGHSSTSVSLAVGAAKAIRLRGEEGERIPVVMIGDGAMSAGMVYEALNELGDRKYPAIIILNDNEMSIAKPIGSISRILSQAMASPFYQRFKERTEQMLEHFPESARYMAKRMEEGMRMITPGILFEEMGLEYIGPVDGHNIGQLIETLQTARDLGKPVIVHAQTTKGKGYKIAEGYYEHWHGVGPFDKESGQSLKKEGRPSATKIFSDTLCELAEKSEKIVGVTAAMPSGTGMKQLMERFPERFWDVGIAEQHAVTSMGPLAKEGYKPFVAIYSTFLQRGYDQVIHDIALMNLPVAFAIDRAGIVGEDGETHQGAFDISYLRTVPNMTLFAPRDDATLRLAVEFAADFPTPCAFRYPRGAMLLETGRYRATPFVKGKAEYLEEEGEILLIGYGNGVGRAVAVMDLLKERGIKAAVLDLRFVKPIDKEVLEGATERFGRWFVFSDGAKMGGVASAVAEALMPSSLRKVDIHSFEYEDAFIPHGNTKSVEESLGLLPKQIVEKIEKRLKEESR
ncbi:1-deoxy-D-xylulose-5-phosphate synthase [Hydrogenimonas urashimensis]|uniref:1-deoxy-D-xylulose-5-phosphate synthase n=1 Tax=Hydrogenimonas urashimensis TaxID=2740515 RepID=UPI0019165980|nr:1-deoxy-D-xylulose-5-phosphate synthase [Hydrogenimonas urashimensis]